MLSIFLLLTCTYLQRHIQDSKCLDHPFQIIAYEGKCPSWELLLGFWKNLEDHILEECRVRNPPWVCYWLIPFVYESQDQLTYLTGSVPACKVTCSKTKLTYFGSTRRWYWPDLVWTIEWNMLCNLLVRKRMKVLKKAKRRKRIPMLNITEISLLSPKHLAWKLVQANEVTSLQ